MSSACLVMGRRAGEQVGHRSDFVKAAAVPLACGCMCSAGLVTSLLCRRGIRSVLGAYTPSSEARSEAARPIDLGAHRRVSANFGASGDLRGREWEPFFGKDLLQNK